MKRKLYSVASEYIEVIEKIEQTSDLKKLQNLEEQRSKLHWEFIEILKEQGISFKDREHATRIALRIAKDEL